MASAISELYVKASRSHREKDYITSAETYLDAARIWALQQGGRSAVYRCGMDAAKNYALNGNGTRTIEVIKEWILPNRYAALTNDDVASDLKKISEILFKSGAINDSLTIFKMASA